MIGVNKIFEINFYFKTSFFPIQEDASILNIRWLEADCHIDLPVEQVKWIEEVSKLRNAYFC